MKGFLESSVVNNLASAFTLTQNNTRYVCTNFLLSLNRSIHEYIWTFRCDKQIKWEEANNIIKEKHDKSFQKHFAKASFHNTPALPSSNRDSTTIPTPSIIKKNSYIQEKEA
jgi:hypothetical protein